MPSGMLCINALSGGYNDTGGFHRWPTAALMSRQSGAFTCSRNDRQNGNHPEIYNFVVDTSSSHYFTAFEITVSAFYKSNTEGRDSHA